MRVAGTPVAAPQDSVMPQTSSIGTPSARYHFTSSGEIGAAPVTQEARAVDADQLAHVVQREPARQRELELEAAASTGSPASTLSAICVPTPMPQA